MRDGQWCFQLQMAVLIVPVLLLQHFGGYFLQVIAASR
jgi:hypothetical protein